MTRPKDQIITLYRVLQYAQERGVIKKDELNKLLGSARRCDTWLEKVLLKDKLLKVSHLAKTGSRTIKCYILDELGFKMLEMLSRKECLDALCFTKGVKLMDCTWSRGV